MRLIDADVLKGVEDSVLCSRDYARGWNDCIAEARHAPTVDAEPVVRCKDCKHWICSNFPPLGHCRYGRLSSVANAYDTFFCADGEKKTEATESERRTNSEGVEGI